MRDFFISYTKADGDWAGWIAATLEDAGYTTHIQLWDFRPGMNFLVAMNDAAAASKRTIAVLSSSYLQSLYATAEWSAALARDPDGRKGILLPIRVTSCELPPAFAPIAYCDLVGLDERSARAELLQAVKPGRVKPAVIRFPGKKTSAPAAVVPGSGESRHVAAARELAAVLDTAFQTFVAQNRLRNQLVAQIRKRLGISDRLEYEAFFHKYFRRMDEEERRLHAIIRAYTDEALSEYNKRALEIVKEHYLALLPYVPSLKELREHLEIWLAKYRGVFKKTPSMCLVYVGVEERVPFPKEIDGELRDYLAGKSPAFERTRKSRPRSTRSSRTRRSMESID